MIEWIGSLVFPTAKVNGSVLGNTANSFSTCPLHRMELDLPVSKKEFS